LSRIAFPYFIHKRREQQEKKVSEKEQNASSSVINSFDGDLNTLHVIGTSALRDWHFAISDLQKTTMIDGNIVTKASVAPWRLRKPVCLRCMQAPVEFLLQRFLCFHSRQRDLALRRTKS